MARCVTADETATPPRNFIDPVISKGSHKQHQTVNVPLMESRSHIWAATIGCALHSLTRKHGWLSEKEDEHCTTAAE